MPGRILSVEDDPDTAEMLASILELSGYDVVTADRARIALDLLLAEPFDLLITDYMLPENDGAWLIRNARAAGRVLPTVLCTAHPAPPKLEGVVVVTKPLDLDRFVAKIGTLLESVPAPASTPVLPLDCPLTPPDVRARANALCEKSRSQLDHAHRLCAKSDVLCERMAFQLANRDDASRRLWRALARATFAAVAVV